LDLPRKRGVLGAALVASFGLHGVAFAALAWMVGTVAPVEVADGDGGAGDGLIRVTLLWEDAGTASNAADAAAVVTPAPPRRVARAPEPRRMAATLPAPGTATPVVAPRTVEPPVPAVVRPASVAAIGAATSPTPRTRSGTAGDAAPGRGTAPAPGPLARVARPLSEIRPDYPMSARRRGDEAEVIVEAWVGPNGRVARTRVRKSGGRDFDTAAVDAVREARFAPAWRDGGPVASVVAMRLHFELER